MAIKDYVGKTALTHFLSNLYNTFSLVEHEHTTAEITDWESATVTDDGEGNVAINFGYVTSIQSIS